MKRSDIVAGFKRRQRLWRVGDASGLAEAYALDGLVESPIFGHIRGRAEIATSFQELFTVFHEWSRDEDSLVIDGDRAAQSFSLQGLHSQPLFGIAPTWLRFDVQGVMFVRFVGERIVHEQQVYDFSKMPYELNGPRLRLEVRYGAVEAVIPQFAVAEGVDLVVMGTTGRKGLVRWLLGSTAERVIRKLPCSLVVVKPDEFVSPIRVSPTPSATRL